MAKFKNYSLNQMVTLILILICLSALAFSLFKITYALLTKPFPEGNSGKWNSKNPKNPNKTFALHTNIKKNIFFLTLEDFAPAKEQVDLTEGQEYFIIKTFEQHTSNTQCLYGVFQLIKKTPNQLKFKVLNHFSGKKIEQYGLVTSQNLKYSVLEKEQLSSKILNCKNWVYVENVYQIEKPKDIQKNHQVARMTVIPYSKLKCKSLNSSNLVAVRSNNPDILYFEYNQIQNKLKLCVKKAGIASTEIMTLNSGKFHDEYFQIQK